MRTPTLGKRVRRRMRTDFDESLVLSGEIHLAPPADLWLQVKLKTVREALLIASAQPLGFVMESGSIQPL